MADTDLRGALRALVTDSEPPMGLAAADVLTAGRRDRRRRQAMAVAGVALASVLVAAGVTALPRLLVPPEPGVSGIDPAGACAASAGPRPPGEVRADQPFTPAVAAWVTERLTCHLATALPRMLPTAEFAPMPGAPAGALVGYWPGEREPGSPSNRATATALVMDAAGTGGLTVTVGVVDEKAAASAFCQRAWGPASGDCPTAHPGPHVGRMSTTEEGLPGTDGAARRTLAEYYRGRTVVIVEATDTDRRLAPAVATRSGGPVLTVDQAADLAAAPELHLFP